MKEQDKTPEEELSEVDSQLPQKEFKVIIVKIIKDLGQRMDEQSKQLEIFNKKKIIKYNQAEIKTIMTK